MKKVTIPLSKIVVNPENPRFEPVKTERDAINLMLGEAGEKVFNLARDIVQHGQNPIKNILVVSIGGGKYMPLEGNRRVIAMKLLHDPELTNDVKFVERFRQLKKESGVLPAIEIDCVVSPDRESAYRWVNLEHTGENKGVGVVDWDAEQRERFVAQYTGKKLSYAVQVIDFSKENNIKHGKIDTTTLDRLLGSPSIRKQIGIEFPEGLLKVSRSKTEILDNLGKILVAMSNKEFKVADVYDVERATAWISKVLAGTGAGTGDGKDEPTKSEDKKKTGKTKSKPDPLDGDWISNQLHAAYPANNRVKAILGELKGLNPATRPNVCATSLRVLLELAVYTFLWDNGGIQAIIAEEKKRLEADNRKRSTPRQWEKNWSPTFQRTLSYLSANEDLMKDPADRKALSTFLSKNTDQPFLTELNLFTHNPSYAPDPNAITDIWCKLGKLVFKCILQAKNEDSSAK